MAKARRPRNFAAMRSDRVRAMAAAELGREFKSKAAAVKALSKLPVERQRALRKQTDAQARSRLRESAKPKSAHRTYSDQMRGGIAKAPSSLKLAGARPEAVMRLARASTGITPKSHTQALTLLAKFGSTDMAKAAGGAIGFGGLRQQSGPTKAALVQQYKQKFGVAPASKISRTKAALQAAIKGKAGAAIAVASGVLALASRPGTAEAAGKETGMVDRNAVAGAAVGGAAWGTAAVLVARKFGASGGRAGLMGAAAGAVAGSVLAPSSAKAAEPEKPKAAPAPAASDNFRAAQDVGIRNQQAEQAESTIVNGVRDVISGTGSAAIGTVIASVAKSAERGAGKDIVFTAVKMLGRGHQFVGAGQAVLGAAQIGIGAYMNSQAKSKAEAAPAPSNSRRAAAAPEPRGSGPVEVPGYTRADGVQVKGYTRQRNQ